jgi:coatomer subunit gamma
VTDPKSEYQVAVIKYLFDEHIVCEFKVKNQLENHTLCDVHIELTSKNENLHVDTIVPALQIEFGASSNVLVGI